MKDCEICGAPDVLPVVANCGHRAWVCRACLEACPTARRACLACEEKGK